MRTEDYSGLLPTELSGCSYSPSCSRHCDYNRINCTNGWHLVCFLNTASALFLILLTPDQNLYGAGTLIHMHCAATMYLISSAIHPQWIGRDMGPERFSSTKLKASSS